MNECTFNCRPTVGYTFNATCMYLKNEPNIWALHSLRKLVILEQISTIQQLWGGAPDLPFLLDVFTSIHFCEQMC